MTADPWELVQSSPVVGFLHAHPDDETLATGPLIAHLAADHRVVLLTATRGELGEAIPAALPADADSADLVALRQRELDAACAALGVHERVHLGQAPARAEARPERIYRDSGMRWITPTLAGPAEIDPESLAAADLDEAVADVLAWLRHTQANLLVTYDPTGGYGHPDHLRCHELGVLAADRVGIALVEILPADAKDQGAWRELGETAAAHRAALAAYRSQFQVHQDHLVHVGGQRQPLDQWQGLALNSGSVQTSGLSATRS